MSAHCCPICRGAIGVPKSILYSIKEKSFEDVFTDDELDKLNNADWLKNQYAYTTEENKKYRDRITLLIKGEKDKAEKYESELAEKEQKIVIYRVSYIAKA
jgi:hypothetical protein